MLTIRIAWVDSLFRGAGPGVSTKIAGALTRVRDARSSHKRRRNHQVAGVEPLEQRLALSGASLHLKAILGTIGGQITDQSTGKGVKHVEVELINANGKIVQRTFTKASGQYQFNIKQSGPYVVREVTPRGMVQLSPGIGEQAPVGAYDPGDGPNSWNYTSTNTNPADGPVGPAAWGSIASAGTEPFESPVNLKGRTVNLGNLLSINFNGVPKAIINNSHQIQVQYPYNPSASNSNSVTIAGTQFDLTQFHYHAPSENVVNGKHAAMEEHFVTTSASGAEAVLAVFLNVGAHNDALDPILNAALEDLTTDNSKTTISSAINFAGLLPTNLKGWYFEGSLTTPPLSQQVYWFVFQTPITLDANQLAEYQTVATDGGFLPNARPVQPQDGRQFNEIDNDVYFQNQSVSNVNFVVAPKA